VALSQTPTNRKPVRLLTAGDTLAASGQTVVSVSDGLNVPRGKLSVVVRRPNGTLARKLWNQNTLIGVTS
jgi:hypothetical protein